MVKKYNINELLDLKKDLEKQEEEKKRINASDIQYKKDIYIDHASNTERVVEDKPKIDINEYTKELNSILDQKAKVSTAITKFNSTNTIDLLNKREGVRIKYAFLNTIKANMNINKKFDREATRTKEDGTVLETRETIVEPMFDIKEIEKQMNELAAEERKINTKIQKINLNAEIEL